MKRKQKTEYEVCEVDEFGDIQDVEYFDSLKAAKDYKSSKQSDFELELWRTVWNYTDLDGGENPDKVSQELIK